MQEELQRWNLDRFHSAATWRVFHHASKTLRP
jgi:hypothetical protein